MSETRAMRMRGFFVRAVILVRGACTGHRVLPSANVPRPSASSLISLREAPSVLRTPSAVVVLADQQVL
ncbi:hypothetical protein D3C85_1485800 [compost metagenome]